MAETDVSEFLSEASLWVPRDYPFSAWYRNAPFAFWAVRACMPKVLVELGTHHGFSYLCFCQAVATIGSETQCFAVDTWEGDEHAGFYGQEVLTELRQRHDSPYSGFSRLIQSTFDEAAGHFEDGSIDLLHIDGRHFYEDVRHDFETWLPKMSNVGVVLFHDINVRERGFGVHKLWSDLETTYPSFAFTDEHGLGVLAVGDRPPAPIEALIIAGEDAQRTHLIRSLYQRLGDAVVLHAQTSELRSEVDSLSQELSDRISTLGARESEIRDLHLELGRMQGQLQSERAAHADQRDELAVQRDENEELARKERDLRRSVANLAAEVERLSSQIHSTTSYVRTLEANLNEIYSSRSWKSISAMRTTASRYPKLIGAPLRSLRTKRSSLSTESRSEAGAGRSLLDEAYVFDELGAEIDVDRYLSLPPSSTVAPIAIASQTSMRSVGARSVGEYLDFAAADPGLLNPLLRHGWPSPPALLSPPTCWISRTDCPQQSSA